MLTVDVVVAVCNEEGNIPSFVDEIESLNLPRNIRLRVVFVEDSSTDRTRPLLRELARSHSCVSYYFLTRGYGQGLAIVFGMSRSEADAIIMMDGDGSHPIAVIPELIQRHLAGAKVVQCVRQALPDRKLYRKVGARVFQALASIVTGADTLEQNIFYRLVSREIAKEICVTPRYWRWLRFPLPHDTHGAVAKVHINSRERIAGASKYTLPRLVGLAIDGVLSLVSVGRLLVILGLTGAFTLLLMIISMDALALTIGGFMIVVMVRYYRLVDSDVLARMEVEEVGNVLKSGRKKRTHDWA